MPNEPTATMADGTVLPLVPVVFNYDFKATVSLDGRVVGLESAYRGLLTYREWASALIAKLQTENADMKEHESVCPLAQQEAKERE